MYKADPAQQVYVDLTGPLVGSGSLRMVGAATPGALQARYGQPTQRGFRQGRVTTLLAPVAGTAGVDLYGVYGLASQADLTGTSGTGFAAMLVPGTPWEVQLLQLTAGFGSALTVLQSTPLSAMAYGTMMSLQLQWIGNPQIGTGLRIAHGTALDFSDLHVLPFIQLPTLFIDSSAGEGPVAYLSATGDVRFDQTALEQI
jgi:hypothetical protein